MLQSQFAFPLLMSRLSRSTDPKPPLAIFPPRFIVSCLHSPVHSISNMAAFTFVQTYARQLISKTAGISNLPILVATRLIYRPKWNMEDGDGKMRIAVFNWRSYLVYCVYIRWLPQLAWLRAARHTPVPAIPTRISREPNACYEMVTDPYHYWPAERTVQTPFSYDRDNKNHKP